MAGRNPQGPTVEFRTPTPVVDPTSTGVNAELEKARSLVERIVADPFVVPKEPWDMVAAHAYLFDVEPVTTGETKTYTVGGTVLSEQARDEHLRRLALPFLRLENKDDRKERGGVKKTTRYGELPDYLKEEMRATLRLKYPKKDADQLDAACADDKNMRAYQRYLRNRLSLSNKLAIRARIYAANRKLGSQYSLLEYKDIVDARDLLKEHKQNVVHGVEFLASEDGVPTLEDRVAAKGYILSPEERELREWIAAGRIPKDRTRLETKPRAALLFNGYAATVQTERKRTRQDMLSQKDLESGFQTWAQNRVQLDKDVRRYDLHEDMTWYEALARKAGKFALAKTEQLAAYTGNHLKEYLKTPQGKKVVLTAGACALGYIMLRGGDKKDR